jgi:hypothetical protein
MGHLDLIGSVLRMFIGEAGLGGNHLNAVLGTGIDIPDHSGAIRSQLIEFVDPVLDGLNMPPNVLLAGEWVQQEPGDTGLIAIPPVLAWNRLQRFIASGRRGL